MKQTLLFKQLFILLILTCSKTSFAQNQYTLLPNSMPAPVHYVYVSPEGTVDCTEDEAFMKQAISLYNESIKMKDGNGARNMAPPLRSSQGIKLRSGESISAATFTVTYTGFTPEAEAAFQRAVDIWSALITSPQTIRINASFSALSAGVLGSAGANRLRGLISGGETTWYPDPLADKLTNSDLGVGLSDINATFNSSYTNFYFGLDGIPQAGKIDFVSVVLHEIGHGLGFSGSGRSGSNRAPCTNTVGEGCWGFVSGLNTIPIIYDRSVQNGSNVSIINTGASANPSTQLHSFITTNNLFFAGSNVKASNSLNPAKLYAPVTYSSGSTYSHFDESTYSAASGNALMTPSISTNEVQQFPGKLGCALLKDLGWTLAGACDAALPVQLSIKLLLEGPYDKTTGLMNDVLRANNKLPTNQPFNTLTFTGTSATSYSGTESTTSSVLSVTGNDAIVDWVLLELRDVNNRSNVIARRAALLQKDGDIVDVDGVSSVIFNGLSSGSYHLSIRHRVHFATRTNTALTLNNNTTTAIDFTNNSNALTNSLVLLPKVNVSDPNRYGVYSGDVDRSGFIVVTDINAVRAVFNTTLSAFDYLTRSADVDMNGFIVVTDINLIRANFNKIQVNLGQ